jgi:hypothetical protein
MAPNVEKRTVSSAHAPDLDSDRFAVQELEPLLELGDNQGWFRERLSLIHILYDEITTYDHAVTRPWTITRSYQRTAIRSGSKTIAWTTINTFGSARKTSRRRRWPAYASLEWTGAPGPQAL